MGRHILRWEGRGFSLGYSPTRWGVGIGAALYSPMRRAGFPHIILYLLSLKDSLRKSIYSILYISIEYVGQRGAAIEVYILLWEGTLYSLSHILLLEGRSFPLFSYGMGGV